MVLGEGNERHDDMAYFDFSKAMLYLRFLATIKQVPHTRPDAALTAFWWI